MGLHSVLKGCEVVESVGKGPAGCEVIGDINVGIGALVEEFCHGRNPPDDDDVVCVEVARADVERCAENRISLLESDATYERFDGQPLPGPAGDRAEELGVSVKACAGSDRPAGAIVTLPE